MVAGARVVTVEVVSGPLWMYSEDRTNGICPRMGGGVREKEEPGFRQGLFLTILPLG